MSTFSAGQKALYVLSAPFCSLVFGYVVWRIAKRDLSEHETLFDRLNWLYAISAGALVVKLLTNVLPHALFGNGFTYYALSVSGMALSYLCMVYVQQCMRVMHSNPTYISPAGVAESQEPLLGDGEKTHVRVSDLKEFRAQLIQGQDIIKDKTKRRVLMAVLYWTIIYLTVLDGIFAVYWSDKSPLGPWGISSMSWISRWFDSCIIYCSLVHALVHSMSKQRWYKWFFAYSTLSILWFLTLIFSTLPVLVNMTVDQATYIVQFPAWAFFYMLGGGILLWMTTYFTWLSAPAPSRTSVKWRLTISTTVICVGILIGIFV